MPLVRGNLANGKHASQGGSSTCQQKKTRENWRRLETHESMTALPLLVIWRVWLARNNIIFNDKLVTPSITTNQVCGILPAYPQHIRVQRQREVLERDVDISIP